MLSERWVARHHDRAPQRIVVAPMYPPHKLRRSNGRRYRLVLSLSVGAAVAPESHGGWWLFPLETYR